MTQELVIKKQAYRKMTLHALKYLTEDVFGFVVGKIDQYQISVHDVYPLFHSKIPVPMLEVGADIVEGLASKEGLKIIGIYESLIKNFSGDEIESDYSDIATRILDNLFEAHQKNPLLISVQEKKANCEGEGESAQILKPEFIFKAFQGKKVSTDLKIEEITTLIKEPSKFNMKIIEKEVSNKEYRMLADFQNHLENLNEDFRNTFLNDA